MLKEAILGCGQISEHYFRAARDIFGKHLHMEACADLILDRAKAAAAQYGIAKAYTPEELLNDPDVELIVNLTVPQAHYKTSLAAIEAGKHVYTEKPFGINRQEAASLLEAAQKKGVWLGCAPDTFMSAPVQTGKKLLEQNIIGDIVGVNAVCPMRGNEFWRPDADFFYHKGAGPIWDMAAYYFNVMIALFGSFKSVTALGRITWAKRPYHVESRKGDYIDVEVPTHTVGLFEMENGVLFNFTNSFDMYKTDAPYIEIYGEKGTLILPFPNHYDGDVLLSMAGAPFEKVEQLTGYDGFMRSAGIADMAVCMQNGKKYLANGEMAYHVTDAMCAWEEALESGRKIMIESRCEKPEGLWQRDAIR